MRCWRRAKLVVLDLSTSDRLVVQPRFTGALLIDAGASSRAGAALLDDRARARRRPIAPLPRHSPPRNRGADVADALRRRTPRALGIEPLDPAFTGRASIGTSSGSRQADQKGVDGSARARRHRQHLRERGALARGNRSVARGKRGDGTTRPLRCATPSWPCSPSRSRCAERAFATTATPPAAAAASSSSWRCTGAPASRAARAARRLVGTHAIDGRTTVLCARCQE